MEKGRTWVNNKLRDFSQDRKDDHYVSVEMVHVREDGVVTQHSVAKQRSEKRTNQDAELLWLNKPYDENYDEYLYALNKDLSGSTARGISPVILDEKLTNFGKKNIQS